MGKRITVGEGHTEGIKTDHRNGKQTTVQNNVEVRPVMDGFHNETVRDKYYFKRDFITMFVEDLFDLVVDGKMSLREWRVFIFLCATLNTKNIAVTKLDAIAKELKMDIPAVSATISKLKKRKLVVEQKWICPESGPGSRTKVFQLSIGQKLDFINPNIAYNGQTKDYQKTKGRFPAITLPDGQTLLNPHSEAARQELLREQRQRESLFPEFYDENDMNQSRDKTPAEPHIEQQGVLFDITECDSPDQDHDIVWDEVVEDYNFFKRKLDYTTRTCEYYDASSGELVGTYPIPADMIEEHKTQKARTKC